MPEHLSSRGHGSQDGRARPGDLASKAKGQRLLDTAQEAQQSIEDGERVGRTAGQVEIHGNVSGDAVATGG